MVGAAAAGGGAGGDLRADGGRSRLVARSPRPVSRQPQKRAQEKERAQRLFRIIEDLVQWENTTNETVLQAARDEIWQSWRRACAENADHPRAKELFDRQKLPAFHDPFAGGGALPLEAQRLGLESYASDLNPVAVLINKAMIEIPPKFAGKPPVNPEAREAERPRSGASGKARRAWPRTCATTASGCATRPRSASAISTRRSRSRPRWRRSGPDLKPLCRPEAHGDRLALGAHGEKPEPGLRQRGRAARLDLHALHQGWQGGVCRAGDRGRRLPLHREGGQAEGCGGGEERHEAGAGRNFQCLMSGTPIAGDYIKAEGKAGRMGARLMAIVAEGDAGASISHPRRSTKRWR